MDCLAWIRERACGRRAHGIERRGGVEHLRGADIETLCWNTRTSSGDNPKMGRTFAESIVKDYYGEFPSKGIHVASGPWRCALGGRGLHQSLGRTCEKSFIGDRVGIDVARR